MRSDRIDLDLDLAVELVNTYWVLADPPERLVDVKAFQAILQAAGADDLADELGPEDLDELRRLRTQIAAVFGQPLDRAAADLKEMLAGARIPVQIAMHGDHVEWASGSDASGIEALRARLLIGLADQLIRNGVTRIGVCAATPCNCVYVDRSRARTRRYCCDQCNDRAAAAAYRRRRASPAGDPHA